VVMGIVCWAAIGLSLVWAGLEMPAKQDGWMDGCIRSWAAAAAAATGLPITYQTVTEDMSHVTRVQYLLHLAHLHAGNGSMTRPFPTDLDDGACHYSEPSSSRRPIATAILG
jgi:hypothetical protein